MAYISKLLLTFYRINTIKVSRYLDCINSIKKFSLKFIPIIAN